MVILRTLLPWLAIACCLAGEVTLELPEKLITNAVMDGTLRISDPPADVQGVELPTVAGLEWRMSGRNESRIEIINGRRSAILNVGLSLRAVQRGELVLPPVTVRCTDGTILASAARSVQVDPGDARLVGDAVAVAAFEPATIVPGQPTKLVYRMYVRRGQISSFGIGPPDGGISLGERALIEENAYDTQGRMWNGVVVTWPLTHATPGAYTVRGQQEFQIVVGERAFSQRLANRQVAVAPATLTVEPMPLEGRPADFTGLIGPLAVHASLDRERVSAGEGALLSLAVSGWQTGLVKRPALQLVGAQLYPKDDQTADGKRTFTWDVVPAAAGTVTIPVVSLPYFDPASRSYRHADSQPLSLQVIPGRHRDLGVVGQSAPAATPDIVAPLLPTLPAPVRGGAISRPPAWSAGAALVAGAVAGLLLFAAQRLAGRRRGPHRGRALRAAGRDPLAVAAALQALQPALATAAQRDAAAALLAAVERTRFGGEPLPDITVWVRELEVLP
jgi:hypothetical protein